MGTTAAHAPQEHRRDGEQSTPSRAARLDRAVAPAGGRARVLELQRTIGNAAVARMVKADRRALHRACCSACASGGSCGSHGDDELLDLEH